MFFEEKGHDFVEFEQGTTTNSGTVDGEGNGDIPCFDIKLTKAGERFFPFTMGYKRTVKNLPGGQSLVDEQPDGSVIVHGTLPFLYADDFGGGPEGNHGGANLPSGRVHRVNPENGERVALVANLPSEGVLNDNPERPLQIRPGTTR